MNDGQIQLGVKKSSGEPPDRRSSRGFFYGRRRVRNAMTRLGSGGALCCPATTLASLCSHRIKGWTPLYRTGVRPELTGNSESEPAGLNPARQAPNFSDKRNSESCSRSNSQGSDVEGYSKECCPVTLEAELVSLTGITERLQPTYRDSSERRAFFNFYDIPSSKRDVRGTQ